MTEMYYKVLKQEFGDDIDLLYTDTGLGLIHYIFIRFFENMLPIIPNNDIMNCPTFSKFRLICALYTPRELGRIIEKYWTLVRFFQPGRG